MTITQSSTRLVAFVAGAAVALSLFAGAFAAPAQAASLTQSQISSIVSLLQSFGADAATIANVQASLNGQATPGTGGSTGGTGGACPALSRSLQLGSSGADVKALQMFLNAKAATQVSVSGAGSPGLESTYFGPATKAAVTKFQTLNNVSAIGIVGPATRAAIAAVCGGTSTGGTTGGTPTGPGLSISAGAQPANALAPQSAARVPFTTFSITNNSGTVQTVTGVTVERTGLSVDSAFSGIVLIDSTNNVQLGIAKTLNSNHQAVVGDNFTINPGETKMLTVAGNIQTLALASNISGQIVSLKVVAVNTSAPVNGSLPIMGASHTINSTLSLGSVSTSTSSFDPGVAQNKTIGDSAVKFSGLRFTAGSAEDVKLYSIRWRQVGSASASDLANVVTNINGTVYPTTASADGKYYTSSIPGGLMIAKGNTVDVYVQGDIIGTNATSRTIDFDIDRGTDVYFVGQLYGYGIAVSGNNTPWYNGYVVTLQGGTATSIGRATEVAAQNIAVNVQNQVLGGYVTDFRGESVSVQSSVFTVATSSASIGGLLTNVSIVNENGAVVAGPVDATWVSGVQTLTFTDTITYPVGRHIYTLKGKVASGAVDGAQIVVSTVPSSGWTSVTGQSSGNSISLTQGSFSLNTMTVKGASLGVAVSATPSSQTVTAGAQGVTFANVQLDASGSGEDVRLSSLPIRLALVTGVVGDLSSCQLWDGASAINTGSNVPTTLSSGSTATTFTFDNSLTIAKGSVKTLTLKCNVSSGAASNSTYTFSVNSSDTFNATGITSGNNISESVTTGNSGTMTIGNASLAVSVDSSSPSYVVAAGGQTGVVVGAVKLRATNDNATLTKLGLILTSGTAASLSQVTIWDGATQVGVATFTGSNTTASSTLSTSVTLTKDTDKVLTLKADFNDIGSSQAGVEGALVKIDPSGAEANSSSGLLSVGATTGVAGVRVYNTFPIVATDALGTTGLNDGKLMRFKVTADSHGSLGIGKFTFVVSTTSVTATNVQLFAFSDSSYSSAMSGQGSSGQIGATQSTVPTGVAFSISPSTNPVQVSAGATVYFELRASVAGVTTGSSVVTTLSGDTSTAPTTLTAQYANVTGNMIWSPNATTTSATSTGNNDWTNAFGISGLPSGGLFQTRSN